MVEMNLESTMPSKDMAVKALNAIKTRAVASVLWAGGSATGVLLERRFTDKRGLDFAEGSLSA